jgi:tetratricopeptide (TPR) repeat protein
MIRASGNMNAALQINQTVKTKWCCFVILLLMFAMACSALAQTQPVQPSKKQNIEPQIFQHCRFSGQRCLQHIERFLLAADQASIYWYELMLLKLDSLFILMRDDELFALTSKLVLKTDVPDSFKARLYIYHAKVLYGMQQKTEANFYLQQATNLLDALNQAMPNPLTQLRLINVKLYSDGDYQSGYRQLLQLEKQLQKSHDAVLKYDLYNNMGHFTNFLQLTRDSLNYRQLALHAIQQIDHPHKLAEAHYNLARAHSFLTQWPEAEKNFADALWLYSRIDDSTMVNLSLMYLAEALWLQQKEAAAIAILDRMQPAKIPKGSQVSLKRIQALIAPEQTTR